MQLAIGAACAKMLIFPLAKSPSASATMLGPHADLRHTRGLSLFTWCTSLHEFHAKQAQAWKSVSDGKEEVDPSRWKDIVWPGFQPPDHFKKASAADSFAYLDSTNTGWLYPGVFRVCSGGGR